MSIAASYAMSTWWTARRRGMGTCACTLPVVKCFLACMRVATARSENSSRSGKSRVATRCSNGLSTHPERLHRARSSQCCYHKAVSPHRTRERTYSTQPNVACSWASHNARKGRWRPIQAPLISMHHKMKTKAHCTAQQHAQHSTAQHTSTHSTAQYCTALPCTADVATGALVQQRFCPCRRQLSSPFGLRVCNVSVVVRVRLVTRRMDVNAAAQRV